MTINENRGQMMSDTKTCSRCKAEKPVSDFHRNKSSRDGLQSLCKVCNCAAAKAGAKKAREAKRWNEGEAHEA